LTQQRRGQLIFPSLRRPINPKVDSQLNRTCQIDIIEYVNSATSNQYTLHAGSVGNRPLDPNVAPKYRNEDDPQSKSYPGITLGTQCLSSGDDNSRCAASDFQGSAGTLFNAAGVGVFAVLWDDSLLSIWKFERSQIPKGIGSCSGAVSDASNYESTHPILPFIPLDLITAADAPPPANAVGYAEKYPPQ
jgi:hypothetical protein